MCSNHLQFSIELFFIQKLRNVKKKVDFEWWKRKSMSHNGTSIPLVPKIFFYSQNPNLIWSVFYSSFCQHICLQITQLWLVLLVLFLPCVVCRIVYHLLSSIGTKQLFITWLYGVSKNKRHIVQGTFYNYRNNFNRFNESCRIFRVYATNLY